MDPAARAARQAQTSIPRGRMGHRAVKLMWAVQCCICESVGPTAPKRQGIAQPARSLGFELRRLGTISGWLCPHCCQVRDRLAPPLTRGACEEAERPCPHLFCRYHMIYDVSRKASKGFEGPLSCALDFVRDNPEGATLREIGTLWGCTREGIRYVEVLAKEKCQRMGLVLELAGKEDEHGRG